MSLEFSVDLISDLNLDKNDHFEWTGKSTSLFCVIAGNISKHDDQIAKVLAQLSDMYRGVFYIDGHLEHKTVSDYENRILELKKLCEQHKNVIYLHDHAVILNGLAFLAVNGWVNPLTDYAAQDLIRVEEYRNQDLAYLSNSIRSLQTYQEVKKIVVISGCVPSEHLMFNKTVDFDYQNVEPGLALIMDSNHRVTHWLYGGENPDTDIVYNRRRYVNNPCGGTIPYWPKRIIL